MENRRGQDVDHTVSRNDISVGVVEFAVQEHFVRLICSREGMKNSPPPKLRRSIYPLLVTILNMNRQSLSEGVGAITEVDDWDGKRNDARKTCYDIRG